MSDFFTDTPFRLNRLAARFSPDLDPWVWRVSRDEITALVDQMTCDGYYAAEFAYLEDPDLGLPEMGVLVEKLLKRLDWTPLPEESRLRFLTALYASLAVQDDIAA